MKFVIVVELVYEVDEDELRESYGTTDPEEMAKIDQQNFNDDPGTIHSLMESEEFKITVRPA